MFVYLQSIIFSRNAFGIIPLLPVALSQFLPFSLMYRESTLRRYNISIKSRESPKMEKPYLSSITHPLFGLSFAKIYKANNPLFPRRLLELLLLIKDFSILCASIFVILFSYFNIFGGFDNKNRSFVDFTLINNKKWLSPFAKFPHVELSFFLIFYLRKYCIKKIKKGHGKQRRHRCTTYQ